MKKTRNKKTRRSTVPRPNDPLRDVHARRIPGMKDKFSDLLVVECPAQLKGLKP